jgi:hypothetical protein
VTVSRSHDGREDLGLGASSVPCFLSQWRVRCLYLYPQIVAQLKFHRIAAFGGLIVKGFVQDPFKTILFQMPFGALQVLTIILTAWTTNRFKLRYPVIAYVVYQNSYPDVYFTVRYIPASQLYFLLQEPCACGSFLVPISVDCLAPITLPAFMGVCVSTFRLRFLLKSKMLRCAIEPLLYSWSNLLVQFHSTHDRIL